MSERASEMTDQIGFPLQRLQRFGGCVQWVSLIVWRCLPFWTPYSISTRE
jgi:hypothetical protein